MAMLESKIAGAAREQSRSHTVRLAERGTETIAAHGFEVARRIRTGTFSVNSIVSDLGSPFGGYGKSGLGREHGPTAVDEYLHTRTISLDPGSVMPEGVARGVRRGTGPGAIM